MRAALIADGETFASETDTEVVVHLLARAYDQAEAASYQGAVAGLTGADEEVARRLVVAMRAVTAQLHGTFTLLVLSTQSPNVIVAARRSSPLVIGLGDGENFLGSDVLAFVEHTNRAVEVDQDEVVVVSATGVTVIDPAGNPVEREAYEVDFSSDRATKNGWPTFMEKEIHEQPDAVGATLADRIDSHGRLALDEVRIPEHVLRSVDKVIMIGCGTASYAGQVARYAIEHWCRIPVEVELSSEFRYRDPVVGEKTLVVAISQSGETMDTIQAIRHAREQGAKVVAIVNTPGSTISRESDAVILTHAGPEIAVASTKAFTAQVTACYILGLYLAQVRGNKYADEIADYMDKLAAIPAAISRVLESGETRASVRPHDAGCDLGDLPGPPRRLPRRPRRRAQAQGNLLHPRRGLRRRRAEARPDRARGRGPAGHRHRADPAPPRAARQGPGQHRRRSAPAAPARSSSRRRGTPPWTSSPRSSSACPPCRPCTRRS